MDLDGVVQLCRQVLQDEADSEDGTEVYQDDELQMHILRAVEELSAVDPVQYRETVTADGTDELDVSTVTNLRQVTKVEYPIGNSPRTYISFTRFADTLLLEQEPTSAESIYLYCEKSHTLTGTSTSLSDAQIQLIVTGATGLAAMSKAMAYLNRVNVGASNMYATLFSWGERQYLTFKRTLNSKRRIRVTQEYCT